MTQRKREKSGVSVPSINVYSLTVKHCERDENRKSGLGSAEATQSVVTVDPKEKER